jgi:regulatory protein
LIISKIKRIRGKRGLYSVILDDGATLAVSDWTIGKCGLRAGDDLDGQTIEKIISTESETRAKNIAVNFLSYRIRSSKEIIDHLVKKRFARPCAEEVAHQLQSAGLVNDIKFAQAFVRDRLKRKPMGAALLRTQLLSKGMSSADADAVLADLLSPQNQQAAALQAAKRKIQTIRNSRRVTDEEKQKKRLLDFLLRRGFSYELALKTIRTTMDR